MNAKTLNRFDMNTPEVPAGPEGVPLAEDPATTAARASRYADELAATAEHLLRVMAAQHARETRAVELLRDALGGLHVELDELASGDRGAA